MFNTGGWISETCVSDTVTKASHALLYSRRIKGIKSSFHLSQQVQKERMQADELSRWLHVQEFSSLTKPVWGGQNSSIQT